MTRAVVFAYHAVGVRCLSVLLAHDVEVSLVFTHTDDPNENVWFESVATLAGRHRLRCATPADPNTAQWLQTVSVLQPDFIFSFYYRHMLSPDLLACAQRGALNMHGSLLPKYRGRAPVNWAILRGESQTGATLHYMVERADAGDIVDQLAVPILPDDDARAVSDKVAVAAQTVLSRSLPGLIDGSAPRRPQQLQEGQYFGRRGPEDGRIDWSRPAREIHNLVRAVAPPFPGAFTELDGRRVWIHRTRLVGQVQDRSSRQLNSSGGCFVRCSDGEVLQVLAAATDEGPLAVADLANRLAAVHIALV